MKHSAEADNWYDQLNDGQQKNYAAREVIVAPGGQDNRVFVLEQGLARICLFGDAREQTLGYLKPGSVYVTHSPAWVEAMEPCTIRSWPLQQVKDLFSSHPEMAFSTIREIGTMLNNAIGMIESLVFRSVESRLAHYLLTEAQQQATQTIRLIGNTEILASLLGTSRQTTSTILNKLEKADIIQRPDREHITIINSLELQDIANATSAS